MHCKYRRLVLLRVLNCLKVWLLSILLHLSIFIILYLFSYIGNDRTSENIFKLKDKIFRLDTRKKFLTQRVVRHWNKLSRQVVETPPLARAGWVGL